MRRGPAFPRPEQVHEFGGLVIGVLASRRFDANLTPQCDRVHRLLADVDDATAVVLARDGLIELDHLPESVRCALAATTRPIGAGSEVTSAAQATATPAPSEPTPPGELDPDDPADDAPLSEEDRRRREQLIALFRDHGGNVSAVARAMGKARMQIQRWMRRYKIDPESFRR